MPETDLDALLAQRPLLLVLAGPNGAGKSTFFHAHLADAGLLFVHADVLALQLGLDAMQAAAAAHAVRGELIRARESFITETVFSDPMGAKLGQFTAAQAAGYAVILCFIGLSGPGRSDERVAMRVSQGGHDVPPDRIIARYPRTLANLRAALPILSAVLVFDNDDLHRPQRLIARVLCGVIRWEADDLPDWWRTAAAGAPRLRQSGSGTAAEH